jgi:hypothetical protein
MYKAVAQGPATEHPIQRLCLAKNQNRLMPKREKRGWTGSAYVIRVHG